MTEIGDGGSGMGIDRDDRSKTVALLDRREPHGRLPLIAADLENRPAGGRARGDQRQEPSFALGEEARSRLDACPGFFNCLRQIVWNRLLMTDNQ